MTNPKKLKEEWIPCPPGTLSSFAGQERVRQRRKFLIRAGSTMGALALASGAGWLAYQRAGTTTEPTYGGIACSKVRELAPQFMMTQLDEAVTQQINTHLEQCAECRHLLESMQPKTAAVLQHRGLDAGCQCPTCRREGVLHQLAQLSSSNLSPAT